jgi:hypothetical protein
MKKTFNSKSNLLDKAKNFWFALQLLIVSVSLPVLSIVQMSRTVNDPNSKQQEEVIKNSEKQNQIIGLQNASRTIKLS